MLVSRGIQHSTDARQQKAGEGDALTSRLRAYEFYRPSGVPWLGDVPVHWEVVQLGRIGVFSKGSGGTKDDEVPDGIPCVRYGDLYTTHNHFIRHTRSYVSPAKASAYTPIHRGDVLFPTSGETIEEIGKSAVNLMHTQVLCGGDLIIFRPTIPIEPKFAGYLLDCPAAQTQKSLMGRGITIMHIYSGQLKYLWLSLPPLPEQASIVRYLDHVDRRIRRYVSAKRKLIALLEEERQAIVNQAVTRGLDPNVRLKPSGVEWLGDVPEHWDQCRLRNVVSIVTTGSRGWSSFASDTGPLFIRVANLTRGSLQLRFDDTVRLNLPETSEVTRTRIQAGDLLVSVTAYIGSVALAPEELEEAYVSQHVARCQPLPGSSSRWLGYVLLSTVGQTHGQISLNGGTKDGLSLDDVKNYQILLPPPDEQIAIVEHVDKATADVDVAIAIALRQIELVQEYRTRLIADVVTGKLDVREAAAQLPEEAGEEEPIDESSPFADDMDGNPYDADEPVEEPAMEGEVIT